MLNTMREAEMSEQTPEELPEDSRMREGQPRDMPPGEQKTPEQRREGQQAPEQPEEVEDEDVTQERPGTTGAQPDLPA